MTNRRLHFLRRLLEMSVSTAISVLVATLVLREQVKNLGQQIQNGQANQTRKHEDKNPQSVHWAQVQVKRDEDSDRMVSVVFQPHTMRAVFDAPVAKFDGNGFVSCPFTARPLDASGFKPGDIAFSPYNGRLMTIPADFQEQKIISSSDVSEDGEFGDELHIPRVTRIWELPSFVTELPKSATKSRN